MDQMDEGARFNLSPRGVVFEFESHHQKLTARIVDVALERLSGVNNLSKEALVSTYYANWEKIHAIASTLNDRNSSPLVIKECDVP